MVETNLKKKELKMLKTGTPSKISPKIHSTSNHQYSLLIFSSMMKFKSTDKCQPRTFRFPGKNLHKMPILIPKLRVSLRLIQMYTRFQMPKANSTTIWEKFRDCLLTSKILHNVSKITTVTPKIDFQISQTQ